MVAGMYFIIAQLALKTNLSLNLIENIFSQMIQVSYNNTDHIKDDSRYHRRVWVVCLCLTYGFSYFLNVQKG